MLVDPAFQEKVAAYMSQWLVEMNVPGAALAVVQNGRLAWSQGFGTTQKSKIKNTTDEQS